MTEKRELDEYLEFLWKMKEGKQDSVDVLRDYMKEAFDKNHLTELSDQRLIEFGEGEKKIGLTEKGARAASLIVRSHRLAERLIHNVMGCTMKAGLVNSNILLLPSLLTVFAPCWVTLGNALTDYQSRKGSAANGLPIRHSASWCL